MEFRVLGPLEVRDDGRVLALSGGKEAALLALLVLRAGETVSIDRLIDALWGEQPPVSAARSIHVYVSHLRKALGESRFVTRGRGYSFSLGDDALDLNRFDDLVADGRECRARGQPREAFDAFSAALSLWRGQPLAGLEYEDIVRVEAGRLEQLRLDALEEQIEVRLELGDAASLVSELEALVRAHPLRERLRGYLMLALYRGGRQTEALDLYRESRQALAQELGLEPGRELQDLEQAILRQDPALDGPAATVVPGRVSQARRRRAGALLVPGGAVLLLAAVTAAAVVLTRPDATQIVSVLPNSVASIDPGTDRLVGDTPVGNTPTAVVIGERSIWVLNANEQTFSRIDPLTREVVRTIPATTTASDIAFGGGAVWAAGAEHTLARFDPEAPLTPRTISLAGVQNPLFADAPGHVSASGPMVWATTRGAVWRVEPAPRRRFEVVERGCCGLIAIGLGSIWVGGDFGLDRIAVSSGAVQTDITLPFHASSLAVGANGVWVADVRTDRLWLINPKTNTLEASVPVGEHPSAVAVGEGSVWVASAAGTVSRIDPDTARVISTISVGGTPSGIAVGLGTVWVTVD